MGRRYDISIFGRLSDGQFDSFNLIHILIPRQARYLHAMYAGALPFEANNMATELAVNT